ncbi:hypothetical protein O9K51_09654 [Purpureocillium lavendulum]|uniref:Uncharacterized protein n=1 Tax=Purpureocillium lavendulum TaxID=1247861 RepID=A0AB34FGP5_9HYPO|nr:hypothetical protein O9K51_09654 [Purpureocillium lavendulum]
MELYRCRRKPPDNLAERTVSQRVALFLQHQHQQQLKAAADADADDQGRSRNLNRRRRSLGSAAVVT